MKFFLVIFATIIVNGNSESPTIPPTPDFRQVYAHVDACDQPNELGSKGPESLPRFYYNTEAKECQSFLFGGGPYTENNFLTKEACDARCPINLLIGASISIIGTPAHSIHPSCSEPVRIIFNVVTPSDAVVRFYYNASDNDCKSFMWSRGATIGDNFVSKEECMARCGH